MKKIGILNFQYSTHNYGAVLQAAALEDICRGLGCQPQHIDYLAAPKLTPRAKVGKLLRTLGLRRSQAAPAVGNQEAFERFRQQFINRSPKVGKARHFSRVASSFDAVIVGSDQVWRPAYAKDVVAFFLGYVPCGVDRIAYAASFGTERWEVEDDALTGRVKQELAQFKGVSCREASGVEICKSVFGVEAVHVLDPLLQVNDAFFDKVVASSDAKPGGRLVYYKLDPSPEFQEDLKQIGETLGAEPVNIYLKDSAVSEYREVPDWLALIRYSETVVTDSFHCICLALRFGKEVIYCPNKARGQTRLDSLFNKLHVGVEPLDSKLQTPMFKLIKQSDIDLILQAERASSAAFLEEALDA